MINLVEHLLELKGFLDHCQDLIFSKKLKVLKEAKGKLFGPRSPYGLRWKREF